MVVTMFGAAHLLSVSLSEGQLGGDVEHDLLLSVDGVDGLRTRLTVGHIQTPPKPAQSERRQDSPRLYDLFRIQSLRRISVSLLEDFCPLKPDHCTAFWFIAETNP